MQRAGACMLAHEPSACFAHKDPARSSCYLPSAKLHRLAFYFRLCRVASSVCQGYATRKQGPPFPSASVSHALQWALCGYFPRKFVPSSPADDDKNSLYPCGMRNQPSTPTYDYGANKSSTFENTALWCSPYAVPEAQPILCTLLKWTSSTKSEPPPI